MKNRIYGIHYNRKKGRVELLIKGKIPAMGFGALGLIKMLIKFLN